MLSRMKPASGPGANANPVAKQKEKKNEVPKLNDFLDNRDYTGAITLLEVCVSTEHFMMSMQVLLDHFFMYYFAFFVIYLNKE